MKLKLLLIALTLYHVDAVVELNCSDKPWLLSADCSEFYNVKITKSNYDGLKYVGFSDPLILAKIKFEESKLEFLPAELFEVFPNLEKISVNTFCDLNGRIDDEFLKDLVPIKKITVKESEIAEVTEGAFKNLVNVEVITLSKNELATLPENVFKYNENLKVVKVSRNFLTQLEPNTFKYNTRITEIHLDHNKLQNIPQDLFARLSNLESLNLEFNKLETLPANLFKNNHNLEYINVVNNKIKSLVPDTFKNVNEMASLKMEGNICVNENINLDQFEALEPCYNNQQLVYPAPELDCLKESNEALAQYCSISDSKFKLTKDNYKTLNFTGTEDPLIITHLILTSVKLEILPSEMLNFLPNLKSIWIDEYSDLNGFIDDDFVNGLTSLKKLDIEENDINKISENAFEKLVNLERIEIQKTELVTLPEKVFQHNKKLEDINLEFNFLNHLEPATFKFNTELETISLNHNKLQRIHEDLFATLIKLERVEIDYNKLETLPANVFSNNPELGYISLERNKIKVLSPDTFKNQNEMITLKIKDNICIEDSVEKFDSLQDALKPCYEK